MFSLCRVLILALTLVCLATDSEKFAEMKLATASPPKDGFRLTDDAEFPPVAQPSDWVISTLCTFYLLSLSLFCSVPFCGSHCDVYFNYSHSINKSKFFVNLMFFSPDCCHVMLKIYLLKFKPDFFVSLLVKNLVYFVNGWYLV